MKRLLIIDNELSAASLCEQLKQFDLEIDVANNLNDALTKLNERTYDAVICETDLRSNFQSEIVAIQPHIKSRCGNTKEQMKSAACNNESREYACYKRG